MRILHAFGLLFCVQSVMGHGWLVQPCPRSNASPTQAPTVCSVSTGTASTAAQCGKGKATLTTVPFSATATRGQPLNVVYQRANSHGVTDTDVTLTLTSGMTFPNAAPTATNTISQSGYTMDVTIAAPQPAKQLTIPADFPLGPAVLQFKWQPSSAGPTNNPPVAAGGAWFDCADINVVDPVSNNPCNTNNGGCSDTCTVSTANAAVCSCNAGRVFASGSTTSCVALPAPVPVVLVVKGDTTQAVNGVSGQDIFTAAIQGAFPSIASNINFDAATFDSAKGTTTVSLFISAQSATVTGTTLASTLTNFVQNPSSVNTASAFVASYPPVSVSVAGNAPVMAPTNAVPTTGSVTASPTSSGPTSTVTTASPTTVTNNPTTRPNTGTTNPVTTGPTTPSGTSNVVTTKRNDLGAATNNGPRGMEMMTLAIATVLAAVAMFKW